MNYCLVILQKFSQNQKHFCNDKKVSAQASLALPEVFYPYWLWFMSILPIL